MKGFARLCSRNYVNLCVKTVYENLLLLYVSALRMRLERGAGRKLLNLGDFTLILRSFLIFLNLRILMIFI